jgi:acyl-CoA thioesterase
MSHDTVASFGGTFSETMTAIVSTPDHAGAVHADEAAALAWAARLFDELPVAALLHARPVACDPARGRMTVAFEAQRTFCNLMGVIQGGMLTAMLDMAMAFAVLCTLEDGHVVPSLEMKTSFIAPARPGLLTAEGLLVRRGRSVAFMERRLHDADANLLATASATGQLRRRPAPPEPAP